MDCIKVHFHERHAAAYNNATSNGLFAVNSAMIKMKQ